MQIIVTGRHIEVTDALRAYAEARVQAAAADFPRITNVHVILNVEKHRHSAEIVVHAPHHDQVEARVEADNMYAALDAVADKASKQLHRIREKMTDHKSREKLGQVDARSHEPPGPNR